jgi:hypothetical protein
MVPVDRFLKEKGLPSSRYVDDVYVFIESIAQARELMGGMIPFLRSYDLVLNEAKCKIIAKGSLITEEPDLQELFDNAVEEISSQVSDDEFDADYGFQSEWANEEELDDEAASLELKATKLLFDSTDGYPGQEENIERFCLPLFAKAGSDYAIYKVIKIFKLRPAMSQIYIAYLSRFIESDGNLFGFFASLLADPSLSDWQKMWVLAGLLQYKPPSDLGMERAAQLLHDATRHDALRAVAAIYIGRFGDLGRRKELLAIYPSVSNYVQAAIYYASPYWKGVERSNAKATWGGHGSLNALVLTALGKN